MPTRKARILIVTLLLFCCSLAPGCSKPIPRSPEGLEPAEVMSAFLRLSRKGDVERARQFASPESRISYVEQYESAIGFMELIAESETGSSRLQIDPDDFTTEIDGDVAYVVMKTPPGCQFECRLTEGVWLFYTGPHDR